MWEAIKGLKRGEQFLLILLIVSLPTVSVLITAHFKQKDCVGCCDYTYYIEQIKELKTDKATDNKQCEKDKQAMLETQAKIYAMVSGVEKKVSQMQPDTVLIHPEIETRALDIPDTGEKTMSARIAIKRDKKCPVCPIEEVRQNKDKSTLLKNLGEIKKEITKQMSNQ